MRRAGGAGARPTASWRSRLIHAAHDAGSPSRWKRAGMVSSPPALQTGQLLFASPKAGTPKKNARRRPTSQISSSPSGSRRAARFSRQGHARAARDDGARGERGGGGGGAVERGGSREEDPEAEHRQRGQVPDRVEAAERGSSPGRRPPWAAASSRGTHPVTSPCFLSAGASAWAKRRRPR